MTASGDASALVGALEAALSGGALPDLTGATADALDRALREVARRHGSTAVPLVRRLAAAGPREQRRLARLELYRLERAGVAVSAQDAPRRPVVTREAERVARAWVSGIDGSGSRGVWIAVEGGLGGGVALCSRIRRDAAGIVEMTGGPTTRKRLEGEVAVLMREPGLPWVETEPAHALVLVGDALASHARADTRPPGDFERWRRVLAPIEA